MEENKFEEFGEKIWEADKCRDDASERQPHRVRLC